MSKKKPPSAAEKAPERSDAYRTFPLGDDVVVHLLDGGDVEVLQDGSPATFEDGIILRWGRKRG